MPLFLIQKRIKKQKKNKNINLYFKNVKQINNKLIFIQTLIHKIYIYICDLYGEFIPFKYFISTLLPPTSHSSFLFYKKNVLVFSNELQTLVILICFLQ